MAVVNGTKQIVEEIVECLGGVGNIASVTNCMTRLRVVVRDESVVREADLNDVKTVLAVVHDRKRAYEVVVGPGKSRTYADVCRTMGLTSGGGVNKLGGNVILSVRRKPHIVKNLLKVLGDSFIPLIPGVVAAGLCAGFASMISQLVPDYQNIPAWNMAYLLLSMVDVSFMTYITAWTGYRAAERFGATPILGGMLGMITSMANIDTIAELLGLYDKAVPLRSVLKSGKGGVLAVICGVFVISIVEKYIRKKLPSSLDVIFTPFLTLLVCVVPYILLIMPTFGYVSDGIMWAIGKACLSGNIFVRIIVGYVSSALFLPLVAAGMHHGLVALYAVQLEEIGYVTLYPALAMAGAGQVGAAIALYGKAKRLHHRKLCSVIAGSLPAGFLGVGEPLIYGVTLPMGVPFITAGLGAGFGGAFVMGCQVAATTWGPSGILGVFVMTAGQDGAVNSMSMYLAGLMISYVMSYIITRIVIKDRTVAEALGGIDETPVETQELADGATEKTEKTEKTDSFHSTVAHGDAVRFGFGTVLTFNHVVKDPTGIHVRPAGEIAKIASEFDADVTMRNAERVADAKNILELMLLDVSEGSNLEVTVTGFEACKAASALRRFLDSNL